LQQISLALVVRSLSTEFVGGVLAGGSLAGITDVILVVPTTATLRVIFDFFHVRLRTE